MCEVLEYFVWYIFWQFDGGVRCEQFNVVNVMVVDVVFVSDSVYDMMNFNVVIMVYFNVV